MERYFVIGADGVEYGPASMAKLIRWRDQGRIGLRTSIRCEATGLTQSSHLFFSHPHRSSPWKHEPAAPDSQAVRHEAETIVRDMWSMGKPGPESKFDWNDNPPPKAFRFNRATMWKVIGVAVGTVGLGASQWPALVTQKIQPESPLVRAGAAAKVILSDPDTHHAVDRKIVLNPALTGARLSDVGNRSSVWLTVSSEHDEQGRNAVCFADGECRMMSAVEFASVKDVPIAFVDRKAAH